MGMFRANWLGRFVLVLVMLISLSAKPLMAQELNCTVDVNCDQIESSSKEVFNTLKGAITEYMNTNRWTDAQFLTNEKIDCRLFLTIKAYADNVVTGDLQVQSSRPVYNSIYTTTLINFKDSNVEFSYQENEQLVFSDMSMESNLTAILNFYAYMILALDYDSFGSRGGELYFDKAKNVVQMAQSTGESGWKAYQDNKNRSSVLSGYTEKNTDVIRDMFYEYHRKGLDEMALSVDKGRAAITKTLQNLKSIYEVAPMSVVLSMFKDAKLDELINIYSKATASEKSEVYDLLYGLYPTEGSRLSKIKE